MVAAAAVPPRSAARAVRRDGRGEQKAASILPYRPRHPEDGGTAPTQERAAQNETPVAAVAAGVYAG
ncbi:hypothetical protein [Nocardia sp. NPDC024068]|uniref:hypothetical protein n=1 Tax=Nocardia sp. NPDC024068 TaxID=3157197 RepID=UPI003402CB93